MNIPLTMKITSEFYVRKVSHFNIPGEKGRTAFEVTLHACGDHTSDPDDEMMGFPTEEELPKLIRQRFSASGVMVLRITNPKLIDILKPGVVFAVTMEEKEGEYCMTSRRSSVKGATGE